MGVGVCLDRGIASQGKTPFVHGSIYSSRREEVNFDIRYFDIRNLRTFSCQARLSESSFHATPLPMHTHTHTFFAWETPAGCGMDIVYGQIRSLVNTNHRATKLKLL